MNQAFYLQSPAKRMVVGLIASVLSVTLLTMAVFCVIGIFFDDSDGYGNGTFYEMRTFVILLSGLVAGLVALCVVLLWALPMHLLLNKFHKYGVFWYAFVGFIPCPVLSFVVKPFGQESFGYLMMQSIMFSLVGLVGACVFWLIVVRYNQNK